MDSSRLVSMLCFSETTDEIAAVLSDAGCSFIDGRGRFHLARPVGISGERAEIGEFCRSVFAWLDGRSDVARIDLGAGRQPVEAGVLENPIKLLHWIITQPAAVDFHPTVNAYIFSSDPDDILPFLPFHPAPGHGGAGTADVVAVRLRSTPATIDIEHRDSIDIEGHRFSIP